MKLKYHKQLQHRASTCRFVVNVVVCV